MPNLSDLGGLTPKQWLDKYGPPSSTTDLTLWPDPYACKSVMGFDVPGGVCNLWKTSPVSGDGVQIVEDQSGGQWKSLRIGSSAWESYLALVAFAKAALLPAPAMPDYSPADSESGAEKSLGKAPSDPLGAAQIGVQGGSTQQTPMAPLFASSAAGSPSPGDDGGKPDCWLCALYNLPGRIATQLLPGVLCPCLADLVSQIVWFGLVLGAVRIIWKRTQ